MKKKSANDDWGDLPFSYVVETYEKDRLSHYLSFYTARVTWYYFRAFAFVNSNMIWFKWSEKRETSNTSQPVIFVSLARNAARYNVTKKVTRRQEKFGTTSKSGHKSIVNHIETEPFLNDKISGPDN